PKRKLPTLKDVGLSYIRLGQPATTLCGGEAQGVRLAAALSRRSTGRTRYILDEPTTGLSFADTETLLGLLQALVDGGNTEGEIVAEGTAEELARHEGSYTARFLRDVLARHGGGAEQPERPKRRRAASKSGSNAAPKAGKAGKAAKPTANGRSAANGGRATAR